MGVSGREWGTIVSGGKWVCSHPPTIHKKRVCVGRVCVHKYGNYPVDFYGETAFVSSMKKKKN